MEAGGAMTLYDVETGAMRPISLPAGVVFTPWSFALAADGRTLYGSILEREADIWIVEIQ
jgi:hypothetical protein